MFHYNTNVYLESLYYSYRCAPSHRINVSVLCLDIHFINLYAISILVENDRVHIFFIYTNQQAFECPLNRILCSCSIKQRSSCTVLLKNKIILQRASRVSEKSKNYLQIIMVLVNYSFSFKAQIVFS